MKPSPRTLLAFLVVGPVLVACASGKSAREEIEALSGCYRFEQPAGDRKLDLPWGLELLDEPLEGWPGLPEAFRARSWLTSVEPADHPFAYWMPVEGDSIRTGHPGGGGFDVVLTGPDDEGDLSGHGRPVGDALSPGDTGESPDSARVTARRVACPGS